MSGYLMSTRTKTPWVSGAEDLLGQDFGQPSQTTRSRSSSTTVTLRVWRAIPSRGIVIAEFPSFEAAKAWFESSLLLEGP